MIERPILMSAPMVLANLREVDPKTNTRRIAKVEISMTVAGPAWYDDMKDDWVLLAERLPRCPYGKPGDRLWVRETWMPDPPIDDTWASTEWNGCGRTISEVPERFRHPRFCNYAADWLHGPVKWRPSIHMPRWASRLTLEVTDVRVERLRDITEADAIAEGVRLIHPNNDGPGPNHYTVDLGNSISGNSPTAAGCYRRLWERINGADSWAANPWVWSVHYRRVLATHAG